MTEPIEQRLAQARSELERAEAAVAKAQDELRTATVVSRSRDRAVEVVVGPQGELTSLSFLENKYRTMSAPQLAASVLEAASEARTLMARRVMETFQPLLAASPTVPELTGTQVNWDDIFSGLDLEGSATPSASDRLRDDISEDEEE